LLAVLAGSLTLSLLGGQPLPAQERGEDLLREVEQRREVERQRIEKEVQDGRQAAYRLVRLDVVGAVRKIRALEHLVSEDTSLRPARRELILKYLRRDVNQLQDIAAGDHRDRADADRLAARRELTTPSMRRPATGGTTPYDIAAARISATNTRLADARRHQELTGERFIATQLKVDKSAVPAADDIEFPADWLEKSKRRSPAAKLSPEERALLEALKKPITVDFNNETLSSVLDQLSKTLGVTIQVDKQALEDVNVTYDTPITLRFVKPVSTRTVLKRILSDLNLTYIVHKGGVEVTSITRAKEMMVTRAYYIGDLVNFYDPFLLPGLNQLVMGQNISNIINSVQSQVEPSSWESRGGQGTITFDPVTMSLIVRQSAEVHFLMGGGH
jgi:hypothetical protein